MPFEDVIANTYPPPGNRPDPQRLTVLLVDEGDEEEESCFDGRVIDDTDDAAVFARDAMAEARSNDAKKGKEVTLDHITFGFAWVMLRADRTPIGFVTGAQECFRYLMTHPAALVALTVREPEVAEVYAFLPPELNPSGDLHVDAATQIDAAAAMTGAQVKISYASFSQLA